MWQYYLILGLGGVFLLLAIFSFRNTMVFLKNGDKATATVTDLHKYEAEGDVCAGFHFSDKREPDSYLRISRRKRSSSLENRGDDNGHL